MRATKTTVTFDFVFRYPAGGAYDQGTAITVCEPAFHDIKIFRRMQAYTAQVNDSKSRKLLKDFTPAQFAEIARVAQEQIAAPVATEPEAQPIENEPPRTDLVEFSELGTEEFGRFCEFVQGALTGNTRLAYIGADHDVPTKDRIAITHEVWANLSEGGGVRCMDQIMEAFVGFFAPIRQASKPPSVTKNGASGPALSDAAPLASSTTRPPRRSPSPN